MAMSVHWPDYDHSVTLDVSDRGGQVVDRLGGPERQGETARRLPAGQDALVGRAGRRSALPTPLPARVWCSLTRGATKTREPGRLHEDETRGEAIT
jgi:hypothetical protein